jgi:hypothetical protein
MTTNTIHIDPKIANHVDAALAAGFTVYSLPNEKGSNRSAGFVAVCLTEDGPFAHIQVPTHSWDPVSLDVPIKPGKDYGSGVLVDHDGTPEGAVVALTKACTEPVVTVRFMTKQYLAKHGTPKVPNYGRKCIERWPGAIEFVKLGQRGTNWDSRTLAQRLEVGDRFTADLGDGRKFGVLTVTSRRYARDVVVLTVAESDGILEIKENAFVTLEGVGTPTPQKGSTDATA